MSKQLIFNGHEMKEMHERIPGYAPPPPEDLRIFPPYVSLFLANIFITMIATICSIPPVFYIVSPELGAQTLGIIVGINIIVSILSILILRGHQLPIKLLSALNFGLALLAIIAIFFSDQKYRISLYIAALAAIISCLIVRSEKYYQVALFWKRMMDRQRKTGLTRAEDIAIHLELEEGTKDGFENAKQIVMSARERIKKSSY